MKIKGTENITYDKDKTIKIIRSQMIDFFMKKRFEVKIYNNFLAGNFSSISHHSFGLDRSFNYNLRFSDLSSYKPQKTNENRIIFLNKLIDLIYIDQYIENTQSFDDVESLLTTVIFLQINNENYLFEKFKKFKDYGNFHNFIIYLKYNDIINVFMKVYENILHEIEKDEILEKINESKH